MFFNSFSDTRLAARYEHACGIAPVVNMISVLSGDISIDLPYLRGPLTSQLQHLLVLARLLLLQVLYT